MSLEKKKLNRLYDLMQRLERAGNDEAAADLRWAIRTLETALGITIGEEDDEG